MVLSNASSCEFELSKFIVNINHLPTLKEYTIPREDLRSLLQDKGAEQIFLWDSNYWYISLEDWQRIFPDVLLNKPKYVTDKLDCEDFALIATARVLEKYQLNTCGIAIGQSPFGEHGYNLFVAEVDGKAELFILEPQNGLVYNIDEPSGYKARLVIMG